MKKILFISDIDNTLMYSYKHKREGDVCIEMLDGKEQSYTSPRTLSLLKEAGEKLTMVMLTTRSINQYTRIDFGEGAPKTALCSNGTILLQNGKPDGEWLSLSRELCEPSRAEMQRMYEKLKPSQNYRRALIVDDMFLYVCCVDGVDTAVEAARLQSLTTLNVLFSGRKIYLFTPPADKGVSMERIKKRLGADFVICAGDSPIDLPMLRNADVAIIPNDKNMTSESYKNVVVCPESKRFTEFVLETALSFIR